MALAVKSSCFLKPSRSRDFHDLSLSRLHQNKTLAFPRRRLPPMASLSVTPVPGISQTFSRLKEQGKVAFIPYITAGDPNLPTTLEALKILDACGSDIIELGMPYSDPLADGPVIQAAATRALAKGTNFDAVISMLNEVIPQISCPIALFSYYNPILKRGIKNFMSTIKNVGVHGLVVPDVPLEETQLLREEASKSDIELVALLAAALSATCFFCFATDVTFDLLVVLIHAMNGYLTMPVQFGFFSPVVESL